MGRAYRNNAEKFMNIPTADFMLYMVLACFTGASLASAICIWVIKDMQESAVKRNFAFWEVHEYGKTTFKWRENPNLNDHL